MVIFVPSEGHITTYRYFFSQAPFFSQALSYQVEQYLRLLNCRICLEFVSLPRNFNFFCEFVRWWQVQSAVHVTTRLISLESSHSAIFFPWHRLRQYSLGVIAWIPSSVSFGSVLLVWFFPNMSDGYMSRQKDIQPPIHISFLKYQKMPLNYQVEQYLRFLNSHGYLFRVSHLTHKLQFLSRICQMVTSTIMQRYMSQRG